jgi:hypothetical protein
VIYDLIGHGLTLACVIYFGLHLRQKVQTLQATVTAQEKTIAAQEKAITGQAEQMKAQSTVLQDVERLNKLMKQVIDVVDPQTQLQREQAYKVRVERDAAVLLEQEQKAVEQAHDFYSPLATGALVLITLMLQHLPPEVLRRTIEEGDLDPCLKRYVQDLADTARRLGFIAGSVPFAPSLAQLAEFHLIATRPARKAEVDSP